MPTPIRRVKRREPIRLTAEPVSPSPERTEPTAIKSESVQIKQESEDAPTTPRKRKASEMEDMELATPPTTPSAFLLGKALFQRGSQTRDVVGRKSERLQVQRFLKDRVTSHKSGALYLSGLPGTGKTALVTDILPHIKAYTATINCMTLDRPEQVFGLIAKEFGFVDRRAALHKEKAIELLNQRFTNPKDSHVLVLDELDHLMTSDQEVLFKIFEWACQEQSNLVMVGIANAIDLTDRFLPRLQAHKLTPQVIAFRPYSADDIAEIIEARLRTLRPHDDQLPLMHPAAVRMCAKKTAANSGDLRKAFDICRRAIEVIEEECLGRGERVSQFDIAAAPKVNVPHISRVCVEAFGGVSTASRVKELNLQQKAVLVIVMSAERSLTGPAANLTVNAVFEHYSERCTKESALSSLLFSEFLQVIAALEATGLVNVLGMCCKKGLGPAGTGRISRGGGGASASRGTEGYRDEYGLRRISSKAQLMDVITALGDVEPLRQLLLASL